MAIKGPKPGIKTHCKHGHELTPENVYTQHKGNFTMRRCKQCHNNLMKKLYSDNPEKYIEKSRNNREKNPYVPHPLTLITHCKYGHDMSDAYQIYNKDGSKNGRQCRECHREDAKEYNKNNPDKRYINHVNDQNRKLYGLDFYSRNELLASQNNACAICGRIDCTWDSGFQNVWHVDHRHDGTVNHRGILCASCNNTLGRLGDNVEFIQKFIEYLKKWS